MTIKAFGEETKPIVVRLIRPKKLVYPRRKRSIIIRPVKKIYRTPDKTVCDTCPCFKQEAPYVHPAKLRQCLRSPKTLYELAAAVVDAIPLPQAFSWNMEDVARWVSEDVGLPQYIECFIDNKIDGMRLLMFDDPSFLPEINIHYFSHIKMITASIRSLYGMEFVRFSRSIGLPPRKLLAHTTQFKSRTGPSWGIRRNWSRTDILRWMKIVNSEPVDVNHWDLVWYVKSDFPKTLFGNIAKAKTEPIPRFAPQREECREYTVQRKFKLIKTDPSFQEIWMERPETPPAPPKKIKTKKVKRKPKKQNIYDLKGAELMLAKRRLPNQKFFPKINMVPADVEPRLLPEPADSTTSCHC